MPHKPRGRPPSAKTLVDRQLGRNVKNPVLPAGESFVVPNHSGDHSEGRVDSTPIDDLDIPNKKYVDTLTTNHPHQDVRVTAGPSFINITLATGASNGMFFGDGGLQVYESPEDTLNFDTFATIKNTGFISKSTFGAQVRLGQNSSRTNPTLCPAKNDLDTGAGGGGANPDEYSLIAGGVEGLRVTESSGTINVNIFGDLDTTGDIVCNGNLEVDDILSGIFTPAHLGSELFSYPMTTIEGDWSDIGGDIYDWFDTTQSGSEENLSKSISITSGKTYRITFDVVVFDDTETSILRLYLGGATGTAITSGGSKSFDLTAEAANTLIRFGATSGMGVSDTDNFEIESISVKEVIDETTEDLHIGQSRGSTTSDTHINEDGGDIISKKGRITELGGYAIKLTNKTGSNSVAGQLVAVYSATAIDDAVKTQVASGDNTMGIVLEAGIADGSEMWVVVSGIADVLMDAGGSARGDRIISSATAGSGDVWNVGGAVATHFLEIGHCIETRTGAGLARCVLHFN